MRGKLRDKRTQTRRDTFKRDIVERRRTPKRENRTLVWLNQQLEEDNYEELLVEEEGATVKAVVQPVRK